MPNKWISVKDKLPEYDGRYLTCDDYGNIHIFFHGPSLAEIPFGIRKSNPRYYQPTHWMPLPEPPMDVNSKPTLPEATRQTVLNSFMKGSED